MQPQLGHGLNARVGRYVGMLVGRLLRIRRVVPPSISSRLRSMRAEVAFSFTLKAATCKPVRGMPGQGRAGSFMQNFLTKNCKNSTNRTGDLKAICQQQTEWRWRLLLPWLPGSRASRQPSFRGFGDWLGSVKLFKLSWERFYCQVPSGNGNNKNQRRARTTTRKDSQRWPRRLQQLPPCQAAIKRL